jgi:hypothetical protein
MLARTRDLLDNALALQNAAAFRRLMTLFSEAESARQDKLPLFGTLGGDIRM